MPAVPHAALLVLAAAVLAAACSDRAVTGTAVEDLQPVADAPATDVSTTAPTTGSTTTTTTPRPTIIVAGDSIVYDVSPALEAALDPHAADVIPLVAPSMGAETARTTLLQKIDAAGPDVVIVSVGVWERRLEIAGGLLVGQPGFEERYVAEVLEPVRQRIEAQGSRLLILGPPLVWEAATNDEFAQLEAIWSRYAADHPAVDFVDADTWLSAAGTFLEFADDPATSRLRRTDGIHLCAEGARRVATGLIGQLEATLGIGQLDAASGWETGSWTDRFPPDECPPVA